MQELTSILLTLITACILCSQFTPRAFTERVLSFSLFCTLQLLLTGYAASAVHRFASLPSWLAVQAILLALACTLAWRRRARERSPGPIRASIKQNASVRVRNIAKDLAQLNRFQRVLLALAAVTCLALAGANAYIICAYAPHHWDGLSYQLARVAYFLQQGSLASYPTNYWAQTVHPRNSAILLSYVHLLGLPEGFFQAPQFVAYWLSMLAMYGSCRVLFGRRMPALWVALMFGLLIEPLLQATTTQNDLIITAFFGSSVFFLLRFRQTGDSKALILAALPIGFALGAKSSSFLILPSIGLVAVYGVRLRDPGGPRRAAAFAGLALAAVLLFALPSGYAGNIADYGNPVGPPTVRDQHSFAGKPLPYIAANGTKNILRFGIDSLSVDCSVPFESLQWLSRFHDGVRAWIKHVVSWYGIDLTTREASRARFRYEKALCSHEDSSFWGIIGFALCFPLVIRALVRPLSHPGLGFFAAAAMLFVAAQAFCGPYDPWRGRYFVELAPFALPAIGLCFQAERRLSKIYVLLVVVAACAAAVCAIGFRANRPLIACGDPLSLHWAARGDRLSQMFSNRPDLLPDMREFEKRVPGDAVVAAAFPEDMYEYPLFGEGLTRRIIPINVLQKGVQGIPPSAQFLVYARGLVLEMPQDIALGDSWVLRCLAPGTTGLARPPSDTSLR